MKLEELVKGRCFEDKLGNVYMFNGCVSSTEVDMVIMEYDEKDDCYYTTDVSIYMDRLDVLALESWV